MSNDLFDVLIEDKNKLFRENLYYTRNMIDYFRENLNFFNRKSSIILENKEMPVHITYTNSIFDLDVGFTDTLWVCINDIGLEYALFYDKMHSEDPKNFLINRWFRLPYTSSANISSFCVNYFFKKGILNPNKNEIIIYKEFFDVILADTIMEYFKKIQSSSPVKEIKTYEINCFSTRKCEIQSGIDLKSLIKTIELINKLGNL